MMSTETTQIRRLQLGLMVSGVVSVIAVGLAIWALLRVSELSSKATPSEMVIEGMTLSKWGLDVENPPATRKRVPDAGVKLQATDSSAYMMLGAHRTDVTIEIPSNGNTVKLGTSGKTDSILEVDTDTGAWTLARTLYDAKANIVKQDRIQLVAPMTP